MPKSDVPTVYSAKCGCCAATFMSLEPLRRDKCDKTAVNVWGRFIEIEESGAFARTPSALSATSVQAAEMWLIHGETADASE